MSINKSQVIFIKSSVVGVDLNAALIAKFTENTWQRNRGLAEKTRDTAQGKNAELAVIHYLQNNSNLSYIPYDDFRDDSFEKHAPFDGIMFNNSLDERIVKDIISRVNAEIKKSDHGEITASLRRYIFSSGVKTIEIKSTKVNDKKTDSSGHTNVAAILEDDFLTYPFYSRSGYYDTKGYMFYAKSRMGLRGFYEYKELEEKVVKNELSENSDLFIRVYVAEEGYYLIGYITKENLLSNPEIKKMIKPGKSAKALYFAKPLTSGEPMSNIENEF